MYDNFVLFTAVWYILWRYLSLSLLLDFAYESHIKFRLSVSLSVYLPASAWISVLVEIERRAIVILSCSLVFLYYPVSGSLSRWNMWDFSPPSVYPSNFSSPVVHLSPSHPHLALIPFLSHHFPHSPSLLHHPYLSLSMSVSLSLLLYPPLSHPSLPPLSLHPSPSILIRIAPLSLITHCHPLSSPPAAMVTPMNYS